MSLAQFINLSTIRSRNFFRTLINPTCYLFYFRDVKFHYGHETHGVSSLLALVKIVEASHHKRQRKKDLLTIIDIDSELKGI